MNFLLLLQRRSSPPKLKSSPAARQQSHSSQLGALHALALLLLSGTYSFICTCRAIKLMARGHGGQPQGDSPYCSFHPKELVVGVCAHCLKDRLLLLLAASAAKDDDDLSRFRPALRRRTSSISLPKVFALGTSFLQRLDSRHHQRHHHEADAACSDEDTTSVASLDDSFISIKFEDNGKATWDKQQAVLTTGAGGNKTAAAAPVRSSSSSSTAAVAVVEHVKRGGVTRWRNQVVGRLLQLARWKRSAATVVGMDGKKAAERSKTRGRGWIRSLTRRQRAWS